MTSVDPFPAYKYLLIDNTIFVQQCQIATAIPMPRISLYFFNVREKKPLFFPQETPHTASTFFNPL